MQNNGVNDATTMNNPLDLKKAEEILIEQTGSETVGDFIESKIEHWDIQDSDDVICKIKEYYYQLHNELLHEEQNDMVEEALQLLVFDKIHDMFFPELRALFCVEDSGFYEKCKLLGELNISAEQFGAHENYTIPLTAAIVELSVIDQYKTPAEKMTCLSCTYDLVFAEIKTAMVSVIAENSERDNDIPIINNSDIIPVLMIVIIKSKVTHMLSNLFYIKSLYLKLEEDRVSFDIFKSFQMAIDQLMDLDLRKVKPVVGKVISSIDLERYIEITTSLAGEELVDKTLVAEANHRILSLITRSTTEDLLQ